MKERSVPEEISETLRRYAHAGVGATLAYPGHVPSEFSTLGIRLRSWPRNELLGTTVTHPDGDRVNFGISYDDNRDGFPNEDMYSLHLPTRTVTYYPGLQFERFDSRYANTHPGGKDYLRTLPTSPASDSWRDHLGSVRTTSRPVSPSQGEAGCLAQMSQRATHTPEPSLPASPTLGRRAKSAKTP